MARFRNGVNFKFQRPAKPEADKVVFDLMRAMRGFSDADIARDSWLSPGTISKIRTRRTRYPQAGTCREIARRIGCSYGEIQPIDQESATELLARERAAQREHTRKRLREMAAQRTRKRESGKTVAAKPRRGHEAHPSA